MNEYLFLLLAALLILILLRLLNRKVWLFNEIAWHGVDEYLARQRCDYISASESLNRANKAIEKLREL